MVAIKITQEIKDKNPSLFGSRNIDDIVQTAIPNRFWLTENVVGGYKHRTDLHTADGWKEVVTPVYDSETQRRGVLIEDGEVFTYTIIDLTPEEIAILAEQALNSDISQQAIDQRRADGMQGYDRAMAIIERQYRDGEITAVQAKNAMAYFDPFIEALNRGQWVIVQVNMTGQTVPAPYQQLFNAIKNKVDTYVQINYL